MSRSERARPRAPGRRCGGPRQGGAVVQPLGGWARALALGACLTAVLAPAQPAAAARLLCLGRAVGAGADRPAAQIQRAVAARLAAVEGGSAIDLAVALGQPPAEPQLAAAEQQLRAARTAYDALDLDRALALLGQAQARLERLAAVLPDIRLYSETLMLMGATHILRGEAKLGVRRLAQAIAVDPEVEPDPRVFNPAMRKVFGEARQARASALTGSLTLSSQPPHARVRVDGRDVGLTPLTVAQLPEGHHLVRLDLDGMRAVGKAVDIVAGPATAEAWALRPLPGSGRLEAALDQLVRRLPQGGHGDGASLDLPQVRALAEEAHADEVVFLRVKLNGERVVVAAYRLDMVGNKQTRSVERVWPFSAASGAYEAEAAALVKDDLGLGEAAPLVPTIADLRAPRERAPRAEAAGLVHAGQARCPFNSSCRAFKAVVVGTTLGAGLGSAGVGAMFYKWAHDRHETWKRTPQADAASARLAAEGRAYALRGDILVGAGAALVLAGGLTWILYEPEPSDLDVVDPVRSEPEARLRWTWPQLGQLGLALRL